MSDRGIKKWAPYKALNAQYDSLNKMKTEREKISKPHLSNDEAERINYILSNYHGEVLEISIYKNGKIETFEATLSKIDPINKKLITSDKRTIMFSSLTNIVNNSNKNLY